MLKYTLFFLSLLFTTIANAQDDSPAPIVARSINSLQFNLGGLFYVHERALNDQLALHLEAGVHRTGSRSLFDDDDGNNYYALRPILIVEPRAYYNLAKRARKGKVTTNNSGNFFGLAFDYQPDVFIVNTNETITPKTVVSFTPRWGIRRQLGKYFDFEFNLGIRRVYTKARGEARIQRGRNGNLSVGLRFGYRF